MAQVIQINKSKYLQSNFVKLITYIKISYIHWFITLKVYMVSFYVVKLSI